MAHFSNRRGRLASHGASARIKRAVVRGFIVRVRQVVEKTGLYGSTGGMGRATVRKGKMRKRLIGEALVLAAAVATAACSSSGSGGQGGSGGSTGGGGHGGSAANTDAGSGDGGAAKVTTLPGTKAFKDLTEAELTQLCNDTLAYFGSSISGADRCKWAGLQASSSSSPESDAMMQMTCAAHQNMCTMADGGTGNNPACFGSVDPSCTATVAQYTACVTDEAAGFSNTVKGFPACSAVKIANVPSIMNAEGATPPASCATFMNACSGLDVPNPLTL